MSSSALFPPLPVSAPAALPASAPTSVALDGSRWRNDALAYVRRLQRVHGAKLTVVQINGLSAFFGRVAAESWGPKIKDLRLLGYGTSGACLQSAIDLDWAGAWASSEPSYHSGYATVGAGDSIVTAGDFANLAAAGLNSVSLGAFFAGESIARQGSYYVKASDGAQHFFLYQAVGEIYSRLSGGATLGGPSEIRDGVWLNSKSASGTQYLYRRTAAGLTTLSGGSSTGLADAAVEYFSGDSAGNFSLVGIHSGITDGEADAATEALRNLALSMGHSALP